MTVSNRTPILLFVVAILQILDWHSTLTAPPGLAEANGLLIWIGRFTGFALGVSLVKAATLLAVLVWFIFWRKHKGLYEFEFTVSLSVLALIYGLVIFNNYVQHP
jgi:Flp pilus assembly protein protease CpaA